MSICSFIPGQGQAGSRAFASVSRRIRDLYALAARKYTRDNISSGLVAHFSNEKGSFPSRRPLIRLLAALLSFATAPLLLYIRLLFSFLFLIFFCRFLSFSGPSSYFLTGARSRDDERSASATAISGRTDRVYDPRKINQ